MKNYHVRTYRKVCRKPDFLYRCKGRRNARTGGDRLIETTISRMVNVQAALEYKLVQDTEEALAAVRVEAAKQLALRNRSSGGDGAVLPFQAGSTPTEIRANRKANAEVRASTDHIVEAHEKITKAHALLEDEIQHTRARITDKIYAYTLGVRKILPDFKYDDLFAELTAYDTYLSQHETLDNEIRQVAQTAWKKTESDS